MGISEAAILQASANLVSSEVDGEAIILNFSDGTYYGLNAVGARIWGLIQEPRSFSAIRAAILEEFNVDEARCTADLKSILQDLTTRGLVEITGG